MHNEHGVTVDNIEYLSQVTGTVDASGLTSFTEDLSFLNTFAGIYEGFG